MNHDLAFAPPARPLDVAIDFERLSGVLVAQRPLIAALALGRGLEILLSRLAVGSATDDLQRYVEAEPKYFPLMGRWLGDRMKPRSDPGLRLLGSTPD
jgi:hypothetical protein